MRDVDDLVSRVLIAVVDGYAAREGMKDRIRALNEWEIARRSGFSELSYAEYFEHPVRAQVGNALSALEREGLVTIWERGARYDSYIPTEKGTKSVSAHPAAPPSPSSADDGSTVSLATDPVLARLDEIIRLLRSIDARLTR
jgi:hypothetical protein